MAGSTLSPATMSPNKKRAALRASIYSSVVSPRRSIWPELVGIPGMEARKRIKDEIPAITAQIIGLGDLITEDYQPERVQIFVDQDGTVTWPPQLG